MHHLLNTLTLMTVLSCLAAATSGCGSTNPAQGDDAGVDAGANGDGGNQDLGVAQDAGLDDAGLDDAGLDDAGLDAGANADGGNQDLGVSQDAGLDAGTPSIVGTACTTNDQCDGGLSCLHVLGSADYGLYLAGGYCTRPCSAEDCPVGASCAGAAGAAYCVDTCGATSDCRVGEGYVCGTVGATDVCLPGGVLQPPTGTTHQAACP